MRVWTLYKNALMVYFEDQSAYSNVAQEAGITGYREAHSWQSPGRNHGCGLPCHRNFRSIFTSTDVRSYALNQSLSLKQQGLLKRTASTVARKQARLGVSSPHADSRWLRCVRLQIVRLVQLFCHQLNHLFGKVEHRKAPAAENRIPRQGKNG